MRGLATWLGFLGMTAAFTLAGCAGADPQSRDAGGVADSRRDAAGSIPIELGRAASEVLHSGSVIQFGTPEHPGSEFFGCVVYPPALSLRFLDHGVGTYTAPSPTCLAPDGGVVTLCDFGLEAALGTTPGTGTLTITKVQASLWGGYEGEVDLAFPADGGVRSYAFHFVAPVCGIE